MDSLVWIIDDDKSIRWVLERALEQSKIQCETFVSAELAMQALKNDPPPSAIVTDLRLTGMSGIEFIEAVQQSHPQIPIILSTAYTDLDNAVSAYDVGAFEYLPKPFDIHDALTLIRRALESSPTESSMAMDSLSTTSSNLIGAGVAMQEVYRIIGRLAKTSATVLITGESGTGKELIAKALHNHSSRKNKPFIALNMAALPNELVESELFGHEKGAFTGASQARAGRFEQANGGTLFLDEIGDMPFDTQTRLLRVLSEGNFYRVGGQTPIQVDTRIIAATHQNLERLTAEHRFREDLFHRLNVIRLRVPPLRERQDDIADLAELFLARSAEEFKTPLKRFAQETLNWLKDYHWPGNVRQLENACRYVSIMTNSNEVLCQDLPPDLLHPSDQAHAQSSWRTALADDIQSNLQTDGENIYNDIITDVEGILIQQALKHTHGNKKDAAAALGIGRNTLTRKLQGEP